MIIKDFFHAFFVCILQVSFTMKLYNEIVIDGVYIRKSVKAEFQRESILYAMCMVLVEDFNTL